MAKCPKCEKPISQFQMVPTVGVIGGGDIRKWKLTAYTCPHCDTVISVETDQVAVREDDMFVRAGERRG